MLKRPLIYRVIITGSENKIRDVHENSITSFASTGYGLTEGRYYCLRPISQVSFSTKIRKTCLSQAQTVRRVSRLDQPNIIIKFMPNPAWHQTLKSINPYTFKISTPNGHGT